MCLSRLSRDVPLPSLPEKLRNSLLSSPAWIDVIFPFLTHEKLENSQKLKTTNWPYADVVAPTRLKFREELEGKQTYFV